MVSSIHWGSWNVIISVENGGLLYFLQDLDIVWLASARCVVAVVTVRRMRKCSWPPVTGQAGAQECGRHRSKLGPGRQLALVVGHSSTSAKRSAGSRGPGELLCALLPKIRGLGQNQRAEL